MRILSTKWQLKRDVTEEQIWACITEWLKMNRAYSDLSEKLSMKIQDSRIDISNKYCRLQKIATRGDNFKGWAMKLSHRFYEQTWDTEIIYTSLSAGPIYVVVHLDAVSDRESRIFPSGFHTDILRRFTDSNFIDDDDELPVLSCPIVAEECHIERLQKTFAGNYELKLPLVYVSKLQGSLGYEVDPDKLASQLAGLAHVLVEPSAEYSYQLKNATNSRNPYGGYIGVYMPNTDSKLFSTKYGNLDLQVASYVISTYTSLIDGEVPSWNALNTKLIEEENRNQSELINVYGEENESLEEKIKRLEEKVSRLTKENLRKTALCEDFQKTFTAIACNRGLLTISPETEFFPYEQYDLIVTMLESALSGLDKDSRAHELLSAILEVNPLKGHGLDIIDGIKDVFNNGGQLKEKDLSRLQQLGFAFVSENGHKKLVYKDNPKYTFILAASPSDQRYAKNMVSDITKRISVYKKR